MILVIRTRFIIMATIDSRSTVQEIIRANGYFEDDPRIFQIVQYINYEGRTTWGITWEHEREKHRYETPTSYVNDPKVIWRADDERYQASEWKDNTSG